MKIKFIDCKCCGQCAKVRPDVFKFIYGAPVVIDGAETTKDLEQVCEHIKVEED